MAPLLELKNVCKAYGATPVLEDVSLALARGGALRLAGPSGSGKTTLLRIAAGLDAPDAGTVLLGGNGVRPRIGMVFQDFALWPHLRAAGHLDLVLRRGLGMGAADARRARVAELLETVDLAHRARSRPAQMSGGEQQRLAFARALANEPQLLILDEPFAAQDAARAERLVEEIARRRAAGVGVLLAAHAAPESAALDAPLFDF